MVEQIVDRQEVLMLIDMIEAPAVPVESKLKAIKRLEYITGRDIPGTKEFRKIRDAYLSGKESELPTAVVMPVKRARKPVERKRRRGQ